LSYSQIGSILTCQFAAGAISNVPGGIFVDTVGRKGLLMAVSLCWIGLPYLVMGLSHILQPRAWAEFFICFREKGAVGSLQLGLLHLPLALLIVAFHNTWQGVPLLVTLIGWSQLLKSFIYLVYPRHGLRMLGFVSIQQSWRFVVAGIFSIALSALIATSLATRG